MLKRLYLKFREEKVFLRALCVFVFTALTLHYTIGYDADWGGTNLTLSIEAAIASAVIMMEQKRSGDIQQRQLEALLAMAESARERDAEQISLMRALKESDERLLKALTEGEKS